MSSEKANLPPPPKKMPRRKIDGWLIIDKPPGITSAQVVGKVKYLTRAAKVGHAGTLDPMATGILPIALGQATKTIEYLQDNSKSYRFTVQWGEERDTDDKEGQVIKQSPDRPTESAIRALLPKFTGEIMQVPCTFSAIKVDGQRAYDLARAGAALDLPARPILIDAFELIRVIDGNQAEFAVTCGKGAYMRGLARDLGRELGCFGHLTAIDRVSVGPFDKKTAITLEKLTEIGHNLDSQSGLLPPQAALDDIPAYACDQGGARILRQGQAMVVTNPKYFSGPAGEGDLIRAMLGDQLVALTELSDGCLIPVKVMPRAA